MEFMPVKVNKAIRSEKKHFFFDFKYLKRARYVVPA